jgi:hypothetical protein
MVLTSRMVEERKAEYQFKNAIMTLAAEAAVLVPDLPKKAAVIFSEILHAIARVKYYRAGSHRPTQPRISKKATQQMVLRQAGKALKCLTQQRCPRTCGVPLLETKTSLSLHFHDTFTLR